MNPHTPPPCPVNSVLNEDRSVFDNTDEVYVTATFVDGDGGKRKAVSNVVVKKF